MRFNYCSEIFLHLSATTNLQHTYTAYANRVWLKCACFFFSFQFAIEREFVFSYHRLSITTQKHDKNKNGFCRFVSEWIFVSWSAWQMNKINIIQSQITDLNFENRIDCFWRSQCGQLNCHTRFLYGIFANLFLRQAKCSAHLSRSASSWRHSKNSVAFQWYSSNYYAIAALKTNKTQWLHEKHSWGAVRDKASLKCHIRSMRDDREENNLRTVLILYLYCEPTHCIVDQKKALASITISHIFYISVLSALTFRRFTWSDPI